MADDDLALKKNIPASGAVQAGWQFRHLRFAVGRGRHNFRLRGARHQPSALPGRGLVSHQAAAPEPLR